jgi:hypothetical protein
MAVAAWLGADANFLGDSLGHMLDNLELYSQNFIFFVTFEWAQYARGFVPCKPFHFQVMQHSSLLGLFLRYEEN